MATAIQVVFDCADPAGMARYWAEALHYEVQGPPEGYASWEAWLREHEVPEERWSDSNAIVDPERRGPRVYFQRVPEGKVVKNRVHLDLNVGGPAGTPLERRRERVDAEVERLLELGARRLRRLEDYRDYCVVMQDPEGNEFCVQ